MPWLSFWKFVAVKDGCWEWCGGKTSLGYGMYVTGMAHREAYRLVKGEIPDGLHVCHTCDNPGCVNPGHLFLGTAQDNARDKVYKNRGTNPKKLDWDKVRAIRASAETNIALAAAYGVTKQTISYIKNGKTWIDYKDRDVRFGD